MLDNLKEDWVTYGRDLSAPGMWVMVVYRFGRWRYTIRYSIIRKPLSFLYKALFAFIVAITGAELPCEVELGHRVRIDHPQGLVVSGDAKLGDDVILRNGVTIGLRRTGKRGSPIIGNRVDIGAGAKILGEIRIGDDCSVGANAVVITDVPSRSIAAGVPAQVRPKKEASIWSEECSTAS